MRTIRSSFLGVFAAAILACGSASGAGEPLASAVLKDLQIASGVPGMAAAVFKDGKLAWHGEAGHANLASRTPITANTRFRLASVSKFIAIAMLARAVERGQIDMARPVASYLPAYSSQNGAVTLFHLATHTSGTPHYDWLRDSKLDDDPRHYRTATESIHIFKDRALAFKPGTRYLYSSFGFNLLSATMEQALQRDFPALLDEFAALAGAPSLQVERPNGTREQFADLYDAAGTQLARGNISNKWAGGGLLSNAADLAKVGAKLLDPAFLSPATLKRFTTTATLNSGDPIVSDRFRMGTGWRLGVDRRGRAYFHHSGSIKGGRSHISVYPEERLVVALLVNTNWVSAMDITAATLLEAVEGTTAKAPCESASFRYTGRYQDQAIEGTIQTVAEAGLCRLVLHADNALGKWLANGRKTRTFTLHGDGGGSLVLVAPVGLFAVGRDGARLRADLLGKPLDLLMSR